ncbi:MAG: GDSL-type esterase/lipase family protein [Muribaculaceae bacterium]|nr:GDSL-type esterase/lipase family protein [Muribaculaceae bacterium]
MKKITALLAAAAIALGASGAKKVHTIGDSTMQTYDEKATVTRGWGQYLQQFLEGIEVNNRGKAGASSKSFYKEAAYWTSVKKQMQPGDYVVIQFAHNDEKNGGMDGDEVKDYYTSIGDAAAAQATDYRGTTPNTTFKQYLRNYVNETRELQCTPILVGAISRMYFSGNDIRRNGRHDLGDSFSVLTSSGIKEKQSVPATDDSMDYVYAMQQVAQEMNVPFIDLTTATADLYISYGDRDCHDILSDTPDGSTHLSTVGATLIARTFAQLLKDNNLLAEYVNIPADLSVTPADGNMGQGYVGQTLQKEFLVSAFGLEPASGTVTIAASSPAEISTDGGVTWISNGSVDYSGSTLVGKFLVRMNLVAAGEQTATISIATPGGMTKDVIVSATGIELTGGVEINAYWRLEKDDSCVLDGPGEIIPESWHEMTMQKYSSPNANTEWPEWTGYDASRKTQRNVIEGNVWPDGEIDEVSTRYIEFGLKAMADAEINIDEISFFLCGCGGSGMCVKVYYSTDDNFASPTQIYEYKKLPANNMQYVKEVPVLKIEPGKSLRLRFYPWYNGTASGKTICLSDIKIHGYASGNTAITSVAAPSEAVSTVYHNVMGQTIARPESGLCIVSTTYADGSVKHEKILY